MRAGLALVCAAWLCACSPTAPEKSRTPGGPAAAEPARSASDVALASPAPSTVAFTLDFDGYGPVRIGMPIAEAERVTGRPFTHAEYTDRHELCDLLWIEGDPAYADMLFMQESGVITRVSVSRREERIPAVETAQGVGLNDDADAVRAAFGSRIQREVAPYVGPPSYDLYVWRSPERGMRFAIDEQGRVKDIYVGAQSIQYMEDCL